jgi:hypothetical protein
MQLKKTKIIWGFFLVGLVLICGFPSLYADPYTYTFKLIPESGAIEGAPGSTIGWGYEITNNDTTSWLATTGLEADAFARATPNSSLFDFPVVEPGQTLSVPYDGNNGLYELTWDANAPGGFINSGIFTLRVEWYDNPDLNGLPLQSAEDQVGYSAKVTGSQVPVPEPASILLMASGLIGCAVLRKALAKF